MSEIYTQPVCAQDWLKDVKNRDYTYADKILEAELGFLPSGTVLGKKTATDEYVPHVAGAADGSEVAAGILLKRVDASGAQSLKVVVVLRDALITTHYLNWHASVDDAAKKQAALDQLAGNDILVRGDV